MITQSATDTVNTISSSLIEPQISGTGNELGQDAFLSLLVTQMRFQDPMKPLEDREFIAQLAQFSSLEQMQQMNQQLLLLSAVNANGQSVGLVGKQITAATSAGETITGRVDKVRFEDGQSWLMVGDQKVNPADVTSVEL